MRDIGGNVDRIARAELRLVVTELRQRLEAFGGVSAILVAAGVAAVLSVLFLLMAAMFALAVVMPLWAAALVIAAIPGAAAVVLFLRGHAQLIRGMPPAPRTLLARVQGNPS
jgi:hypothetical protein